MTIFCIVELVLHISSFVFASRVVMLISLFKICSKSNKIVYYSLSFCLFRAECSFIIEPSSNRMEYK